MSTSSSPSRSQRSRRRRSRRFWQRVSGFWREWRVEIAIALLICLAIFLLVEQMNIRQSVYAWLVALIARLGHLLDGLSQWLANLVRTTTVSDLIAYLLLLVVAGLVIWRVRHRLLTVPRFSDSQCPRCGSDLSRIHRRASDRLLSFFVPVRRFQCKNGECEWRGLRVYQSKRDVSAGHKG